MTYKEIEELVDNFQTNSEYGFSPKEMQEIIDKVGRNLINEDKFNNALYGGTCMRIDGVIITYHCDVEKALRCALDSRDLTVGEWD